MLEDNVFVTYIDAVNKKNSIGTISESTEVQMNNLKDSLSRYKYTFKTSCCYKTSYDRHR